MSSFQGVGIEGFHSVLISGGWNRGVPLYTGMSFQRVEIEGFQCQLYKHYLDTTQWPIYRGGGLIRQVSL